MADLLLARVVSTRTASDEKEGQVYLIDFQGGKLDALAEKAKVEADISVEGGKIIEQHLQKIGITHGWRLVFKVEKEERALNRIIPGKEQSLELRSFLRQGNEV